MFAVDTKVRASDNIPYADERGTIHIVRGSRGCITATEHDVEGLEGYEVTWDNGVAMWFAEGENVPIKSTWGWCPRVPARVIAAGYIALAFVIGWLLPQPEFAADAFNTHAHAIDQPDAHLESVVVKVGEPIRLVLTTTQHSVCNGTVRRSWVHFLKDDTEVIVFEDQRVFRGASNFNKPVTRVIPIEQPDGLVPGKYSYQSIGRVQCGDGRWYSTRVPPLHFLIVER